MPMTVPDSIPESTQPLWRPTVSVIVPIYNGEADLPNLLDCLMAQTYPADRVDYWLVDNGSGDRTQELLTAASETAKQAGLRFHALHYSDIQSSYAARNAGIFRATGHILAFTDADCQPISTWLEHLVKPLEDSTVGIVAGEIKALPSTNWLEHYAERQDTLSQSNTLNHSYLPYGQTANLAIRACILQQVGLFRPHLTTGGDADLCWRILDQTDWTIQPSPAAVVYHRHRNSLAGLQSQWHRYGCSNRYLHQLHGVPLMRSLSAEEARYRLLRWLAKELPQAMAKVVRGQGSPVDLVITPLDLWCAQARSRGQQESCLSDSARMIAPLNTPLEEGS
jgi:glycosyltransferase involved in cell wall biosynthesis